MGESIFYALLKLVSFFKLKNNKIKVILYLLMIQKLISLFFIFSFVISSNGQIPFQCEDKLYMASVETNNDPSTIYEIRLVDVNNQLTVLFEPLGNTASAFMNAVGYRITDNLIYGVRSLSNELYKIDATGQSFFAGNISGISPFASYTSGDVTRDGKYLVLLEGTSVDERLILVDLESPTYESTTIDLTLASNGMPSNIRCADVAFDPTDNYLYGFNHIIDQLVRIDITTGIIENIYSGAPTNPGVVGALFFNSFGELFAYGRPQGGSFQNTLYQFDKTTGAATLIKEGPTAQGNDGCSCPYTININKEVFPTEALPCDTIEYKFTISNLSQSIQNNINFTDFLPDEMSVLEIVENPFGGNIISGVGTNQLIIEDMILPIGKNELVIKALIGVYAQGAQSNQAMLSQLPTEFGEVRLSDNPNTLEPNDATVLEIIAPATILNDITENIFSCQNETFLLTPDQSGDSYEWSDGSSASTLEVMETGTYSVIVVSDCQYYTHVFNVSTSTIELEPLDDITVSLGDSISLSPTITSAIPYDLEWNLLSGEEIFNCQNCEEINVVPLFDAQYELIAIDENGCLSSDTISISVEKNREVFVPNAFSPDGNGFNDIFYLQSKNDIPIATFKIFDRWGALIYETEDCFTNNPSCGWDGSFLDKNLNSGVFIYFIQIGFLDGVTLELTGDITLVK